MESRSRITTPNSSTPSSPKRRSGAEEASQRLAVTTGVSVPPGQAHLQDERLGVVTRSRRVPSAVVEDTDPADLESRSARLIEQLQKFIQKSEQALAFQRNDPYTCGGRLAPRDAEAGTDGRRGPLSSKFSKRTPRHRAEWWSRAVVFPTLDSAEN